MRCQRWLDAADDHWMRWRRAAAWEETMARIKLILLSAFAAAFLAAQTGPNLPVFTDATSQSSIQFDH
jgi:hypothetical protein